MQNNLTSDLENFKKQLKGQNQPFELPNQPKNKMVKIQKNVILSIPSDYAGCGHIRNIFPLTYMGGVYGKSRALHTIIMPFFCLQNDILMRAKALFLQRVMNPSQMPLVHKYKEVQDKFKYKMVYDIDDFIWEGDDVGESIPDYNMGKSTISDAVRQASIDTMKLCDTICVSSEFLKTYISQNLGLKNEIVVIENTIPMFFWRLDRKPKITKKIKKPKIIWTASPTHYSDQKKMKGDMDNAWCEFIIKNVKEDKIDFVMMGCQQAPFFFKEIEDRPNFTALGWYTSWQYHLPVIDTNADFSIGPLVPNYFNYSKSCIKLQEAYASGSLFIGSTFTNGFPSPYDVSETTLPDNCTVQDIEECFDRCTEPEVYNQTLETQYNKMVENGWYLDSPVAVNRLLKVFS